MRKTLRFALVSGGKDLISKTVVVTYYVHMECVAVPENVDAVWATLGLQEKAGISISATDRAIDFKEDAVFENL